MITPIIERNNSSLLGSEKRAEKVCSWSMQNSPGTAFSKKTPFGLSLKVVANGEEPFVIFQWNNYLFSKFVQTLHEPANLSLTSWGVNVFYNPAKIRVSLITASKETIVLWDTQEDEFSQKNSSQLVDNDVDWVVGMLQLRSSGPMFYDRKDYEAHKQTANPPKIIRLGEKLGKNRAKASVLIPLSERLKSTTLTK